MSTFLRAAWRRLTRRAAPPSTPAPIALRPLEPGLAERLAAFWRAFEILRPRLEAELPRTLSPALQQALSAQVDALQSELAWELGRAPDGVFELALSGEGRFPLRRLTEAWRQAAPAGLTRWRFLPARGATPGHTQLDYAGHSVDLGQLAFGLTPDEARARVDVTVWHPGFAAMEPGARSAVAFLALDGLLGEDEVERWVGRVATELTRGEGFVNAQALHAHVTALAAAPHDTFAHLQGKNAKGHAALATLNLALKRLNHLAYEDQLVVTLGYRAADAQGLPTPEEHQAAQALEDQLIEQLSGLALHYGHVVSGGRLEVLFYVADKRAVEGRLAAWRERAQGWQVQRAWQHDPEWKALLKW
jgi:hypothetical protein